MIWAALGVLIIAIVYGASGASPLAAVRERLEETVTDEAKREAGLKVLTEIEEGAEQRAEGLKTAREAVLARLTDGTAETLNAAMAKTAALEAQAFAEVVKARAKLKQHVTAAEWAKVFPPPKPEKK